MKAVTRLASLIFPLATILSAQVGTVQNAALYQQADVGVALVGAVLGNIYDPSSFGYGLAESSFNIVCPGMLAVLSYTVPELAVTTIAIINPFGLGNIEPRLPPPTPVIATLSIRPAGSTTVIPVTVTKAIAGGVTFVVPANMPLGGAELIYKIENQPTQWTTVNVIPSSFAFFTASSGGPAIAQTVASNGTLSKVGLTTPAQPGQTLLLTGSGLGNNPTVSATIAGVPATVNFAGASATQPGQDQILIQIPSAIPDGCYVPVTVTYNQTPVTTTISKTSNGAPCQHPWQLSVNDMKTLDSGGALADGVINLNTQLSVVTPATASRTESANMSLGQLNATGIAAYFAPASTGSGASCTLPALLTAGNLYRIGNFQGATVPPVPAIGTSVTLQAPTTAITLTGTNGYYSATLPIPTDGPLSNPSPPLIAGGNWTWQSSGGMNLPASSFGFTLPAPIQLNAGAPIAVPRNQDQTLTWNGAAFDAGAIVNIYLTSAAASVTCTAPASTGTLTIPAALLSGYVTNTLGTLTINLTESGSFIPHAQFQLTNGNTLLMLVSYFSGDSRPVVFQ